MQDNYQYKQLGLIYEAMANPSSTSEQVTTDDNEEDAEETVGKVSGDRPTPIAQVYKLVRDLAADNPGEETRGSLTVFKIYSGFVKRAKALVDRIDNWR